MQLKKNLFRRLTFASTYVHRKYKFMSRHRIRRHSSITFFSSDKRIKCLICFPNHFFPVTQYKNWEWAEKIPIPNRENKKSTNTNNVDRGLAAGLLNGRERHFNKVLLCCYSMPGPPERDFSMQSQDLFSFLTVNQRSKFCK
mgnify:CR=1 FL=1